MKPPVKILFVACLAGMFSTNFNAEAASVIKYGKMNEGDVVTHGQDLDISWNGGFYHHATASNGVAQSAGTFSDQPAGATLTDSVSGSGLVMTLLDVNGNGIDTADSNNNGTYLAVNEGAIGPDGDLAKRLIDENESITVRFNQDVVLKGAGAMANSNYGVSNAQARITASGTTIGWTIGGDDDIYSYYFKDAGSLFVGANDPVTLWTADDGTADNTGWSLSMLLVQVAPEVTNLTLKATSREGADVSAQTLVDSDHLQLEVFSPDTVTNYTYKLLEQTAQPTSGEWSAATAAEFHEDLWLYRELTNQWVQIQVADSSGATLEKVLGLQGGVLSAPPDDPILPVDYVDAMGPGLIVEADSYADVWPELDCIEIKKAGFNHIRMHIGRLNKSKDAASTPDNNPEYYTNLDRWIEQIARHGMYCHIGNKGNAVMELTWEDDDSAEWLQAYHDEMYDWWVDVADHCKWASHRLAYHLFLETGGNSFMGSADALNGFHSAITEPIRLDDAARMIIYPPPSLNNAFRLVEMNFPYPDLNPGDGITTGSGDYWFSDFHKKFAGGRSFVAEADKQIIEENVQAAIDWMDANDKPLIMSAVRPTNSNSKHDEYISHRVRFIEHLYSRLDTAKYPIRITWLSHDNYNFEGGLGWRPGMRVLLEAMNRGGTADPTDPDGDLISTADEVGVYGTNPYLADSDQDNILDTYECTMAIFDPNDPADGDVITDLGHNADFDGDGLGNAWEMLHAVDWGDNPLTELHLFDPTSAADALADQDNDSVSNIWERIMRINPNDDTSISEDDGTDDWDKDTVITIDEIAGGTWPMESSKYDRDFDALTGDMDPMPFIDDAGHVVAYAFNSAAADSSSQGADNSGTLMTGASVADGIATLDGANDYIDVPSTDFGASSNRSVNLHFWPAQPGGKQELYKEGSSNSGMMIYLEGMDLWMEIWNQPAADLVKIGSIQPQQWHTVTVSFEGATGRLSGWLFSGNTRMVETNALTSISMIGEAASPVVLGTLFNGHLDDVNIYNRGISAVEAALLSRNDLTPLKQPPQIATLPYFTVDPIDGGLALVGDAYSNTLAGLAVDPNGDTLTYTKQSGADWLTVAANGALSGSPAATNTGLNEFTIQVADGVHGTATALLRIDVKELAAPVVFNVLEDSFVQKNKAGDNYGDENTMTMRNTSSGFSRVPYLKFSVSNLTASVGRAVLKLRSSDSAAPIKLYATGNDWTEMGITWSNRPLFGVEIGSGTAMDGDWFEIDITGHITSNGTYSVAVDEQDNLVSKLVSREGGFGAYLEIQTNVETVDWYGDWSAGYGLAESNSAYTVDADGDGLINLHEYAFGGNPATGAEIPPVIPVGELVNHGGSNVVEYVYRRRTDAEARGLSYIIETTTNLVGESWSTNGYTALPAAPLEPGFESVTNRMGIVQDAGYIRLKVNVEE